ncbi:MAG: hypothetical protein CVU47_01165 [Chloroflexi bacterium HGW-Chloroflexi-9]|nr:MAG: hypothetical protein CVU47_01165 [Chloroflexi bacterium HGW-Chloroflexi-9]
MTSSIPLTAAAVAAASQALEQGGFTRVNAVSDGDPGRLFEDPYSVVCLVIYDTWGDLIDQWPRAQDSFVDIISNYWRRGEPKTWDGYLVLITTDEARDRYEQGDRIRYDTTRARKLVASGEDIRAISDIERLLSPLLPLEMTPGANQHPDVMLLLPPVLAAAGVDEDVVRTLIDAFRNDEPLLEAIHALRDDANS